MRRGREVVIIALALLVYSVAWRDAPVRDGDSAQYLEVAADLADLRLDQLHLRSPGYPILLWLSGSSTSASPAVFPLSLLLHGLSVLLLVFVLRAAGVSGTWRLLFAVVAVLPPFVEPAGYVMTENLASFTLVAGLALIALWMPVRHQALLVLSGLAFGYSGITRPSYQAIGLVIAAGLLAIQRTRAGTVFSRRDAVMGATALALGSLLVVGALSVFNYARFNFFGVSPAAGFHLTTKTILFVEQAPDEYAVVRDLLIRERERELVKWGGFHDGSQTIWNARQRITEATGMSMPQLSAHLVQMNLSLIRRAPMRYLRDVVESLGRYWLPVSGPLADFGSRVARGCWFLLQALVLGLCLLQLGTLSGVAIVSAGSRRTREAGTRLLATLQASPAAVASYILASVIVLYTMAMTCLVDIGEPRQRRATDLLILFLVVLGADIWRRTFRPPQSQLTR